MPDSLNLTGPSGTTLNVGSWLRPYDKPDYGAKGLIQAVYSENPVADGGVLAYEHLGVRRMVLPLIIPSSAALGGLTSLESQLRLCARPGAVLDIQPAGMSDAVRFDVISGRWEEEYDTYENTVLRRKGNLLLDVQPLGYLPTSIIVASVASVGLPGSIDLTGVSFIGDAPGLAELSVQPTVSTGYAAGNYFPDTVLWSLGGRASAQAWWPAASMLTVNSTPTGLWLAGAFAANAFAPNATAMRVGVAPAAAGFKLAARLVIPTALEPAYRGRFRVFALTQPTPSTAQTWGLSVDAVATHNQVAPLASAAMIASSFGATPAFGLSDLGEVTLPPAASGLTQGIQLRFWIGQQGSGVALASPNVDLAGVYLHALDGANGVGMGLAQSPIAMADTRVAPRFVGQAYEKRFTAAVAQSDLSVHAPILDVTGQHRGGYPLVAQASTNHLDLAVVADSRLKIAPLPAAVSLSYRPRFYFLHGL